MHEVHLAFPAPSLCKRIRQAEQRPTATPAHRNRQLGCPMSGLRNPTRGELLRPSPCRVRLPHGLAARAQHRGAVDHGHCRSIASSPRVRCGSIRSSAGPIPTRPDVFTARRRALRRLHGALPSASPPSLAAASSPAPSRSPHFLSAPPRRRSPMGGDVSRGRRSYRARRPLRIKGRRPCSFKDPPGCSAVVSRRIPERSWPRSEPSVSSPFSPRFLVGCARWSAFAEAYRTLLGGRHHARRGSESFWLRRCASPSFPLFATVQMVSSPP